MERAIFCKSFRDDFSRLSLLIDSWISTNQHLPLLISVPDSDYVLLRETISVPANCTIITDESYVIEGEKFKYGWYQQQVCKLSIYRSGFADSYLMIDSDSYFVSPINDNLFYTDKKKNVIASSIYTKFSPINNSLIDLIKNGNDVPPLFEKEGSLANFDAMLKEVIFEHERLQAAGVQSKSDREFYIRKIFSVKKLSVQPAQIFHSSILTVFSEFLKRYNLNFYDAIRLSPWEYNWYAYFSLSEPNLDIVGIRSPVLHFARDSDIEYAKKIGITKKDIECYFHVVQMAARHIDTLSF